MVEKKNEKIKIFLIFVEKTTEDAYNASLIEENINRDQWGKVEV